MKSLKKESARVIVDYVRPPALPVGRAILFPEGSPDSLNATQAINGRINRNRLSRSRPHTTADRTAVRRKSAGFADRDLAAINCGAVESVDCRNSGFR